MMLDLAERSIWKARHHNPETATPLTKDEVGAPVNQRAAIHRLCEVLVRVNEGTIAVRPENHTQGTGGRNGFCHERLGTQTNEHPGKARKGKREAPPIVRQNGERGDVSPRVRGDRGSRREKPS